MSVILLVLAIAFFAAAQLITIREVHAHREELQRHEDILFKLHFPELRRVHPATRNRPEEGL